MPRAIARRSLFERATGRRAVRRRWIPVALSLCLLAWLCTNASSALANQVVSIEQQVTPASGGAPAGPGPPPVGPSSPSTEPSGDIPLSNERTLTTWAHSEEA